MMTAWQASLLCRAMACSARVAGMQAENDQRKHRGESMAHGEPEFIYEAQELERLADSLRDAT